MHSQPENGISLGLYICLSSPATGVFQVQLLCSEVQTANVGCDAENDEGLHYVVSLHL